MKGNLLIMLCIVAVIGAALFGDQVIALFAGMTPLEALRTIVTFVLHVAVATIVSYAALTAPELLKPWMRAFRRKRRSSSRRQSTQPAAPRAPRVSQATWLKLLLNQQASAKTTRQSPMISPSQDDTRLNF